MGEEIKGMIIKRRANIQQMIQAHYVLLSSQHPGTGQILHQQRFWTDHGHGMPRGLSGAWSSIRRGAGGWFHRYRQDYRILALSGFKTKGRRNIPSSSSMHDCLSSSLAESLIKSRAVMLRQIIANERLSTIFIDSLKNLYSIILYQ